MKGTRLPPDHVIQARHERSRAVSTTLPEFRPPQIVGDLDVALQFETRNPCQVCDPNGNYRRQDKDLDEPKRILKSETGSHETTVHDE